MPSMCRIERPQDMQVPKMPPAWYPARTMVGNVRREKVYPIKVAKKCMAMSAKEFW
jgi:hypothetical protein